MALGKMSAARSGPLRGRSLQLGKAPWTCPVERIRSPWACQSQQRLCDSALNLASRVGFKGQISTKPRSHPPTPPPL